MVPDVVGLGDRVILAAATGRRRDALGTVIDTDPYPDRDVIVEVLHGDGKRRWRRRADLRRLEHRTSKDTLVAELRDLLGDEAPAWALDEGGNTNG